MMSGFLRGNIAKPSSARNIISSSMSSANNSNYSSSILACDENRTMEALASATEIRGSTGQVSRALHASTDVR
jgi:hypothetical protein